MQNRAYNRDWIKEMVAADPKAFADFRDFLFEDFQRRQSRTQKIGSRRKKD